MSQVSPLKIDSTFRQVLGSLFLLSVALFQPAIADGAETLPALTEMQVKSSRDGSLQPSLVWAPASATTKQRPLFVFLHSWSGNYKQKNSKWQREAVARDWIYLHPNFRGVNEQPTACGSALARQDILDAMDAICKRYQVDETRVYLAGTSGGGHMAMLMAGHHPERFSAVSAWVGISNLADWYRFHIKNGKPQKYARMVAASCGGAPGSSEKVDQAYRDRSPIFHLQHVGQLHLDLNSGVRDGHSGSVPTMQTLRAFNVVAKSHGNAMVTDAEMDQLWKKQKLTTPQQSDLQKDKQYERAIFLRRFSNNTRVTIFDGGHEGLAGSAVLWLGKQKRKVECPTAK